jgi:hypothetical protein
MIEGTLLVLCKLHGRCVRSWRGTFREQMYLANQRAGVTLGMIFLLDLSMARDRWWRCDYHRLLAGIDTNAPCTQGGASLCPGLSPFAPLGRPDRRLIA